MTGEKNGIGVMMHELTINELVVERQYLLKLQSEKIQKCPVLSQLNALVRCHVVTRRVFESPNCDKCVWRRSKRKERKGEGRVRRRDCLLFI